MQPPVTLEIPARDEAESIGAVLSVIRTRVREVFAGYQAYFESALGEVAADGCTKFRETDLPGIAQALLAYYQGALSLAKTHDDATIIDSLADHAVNFLVGTCREKEHADDRHSAIARC